MLSISIFIAYSGGVLFLGSLKERDTINTLIVEIKYFGNWNATITNGEEFNKSGFGKTDFVFSKPLADKWIMCISANKLDDSNQMLEINVKLSDGTILDTAFTSEPFGSTSLTFELDK